MIWIFWVPIPDQLVALRCEEVMLGPSPTHFAFSFSKARELSAVFAGA